MALRIAADIRYAIRQGVADLGASRPLILMEGWWQESVVNEALYGGQARIALGFDEGMSKPKRLRDYEDALVFVAPSGNRRELVVCDLATWGDFVRVAAGDTTALAIGISNVSEREAEEMDIKAPGNWLPEDDDEIEWAPGISSEFLVLKWTSQCKVAVTEQAGLVVKDPARAVRFR